MRTRFLHLLFVAALVLSMLLPLNVAATEANLASGQAGPSGAAERSLPNALEEVPADLQALFAEGMTAEEFVQMAGYVPNALADIVKGEALMIIEFDAPPLAVYYAEQKASGQLVAAAALQSYEQNLKSAQLAVASQVEGLGASVIAHYTAAYNGMQVLTPLSKLNELLALPGVKALHRAPIHEPALGASLPLIGVPEVWNDYGYDGEGMVLAIIDTGIDYTHAVFGGSGDPADYANNNPNVIEAGTFPTAKVIGGYDFAGTLYDAGCSAADEDAGVCTTIPAPDRDPLDENGHGTHVASTAAGMAAGDVADGVAPAAKLLALKVFGVSGSTALTLNALDFATYSYLLYGYPHVINMSLGSNFGTNDPTNPSVMGTQNAAAAGIVVVASAGNAGDNAYITGSPASADKAISVAASTSGFATGPTISVVDATDPNQTNIIYSVASFANNTGHFVNPVTAPLGYAGALASATNNQLCSTAGIAPNALAGQVALIQRGTCAFTVKVNNAAALGAVAAIIYNNAAGTLGMTGDPVAIPAGSIQMQDGMNLIPADGQMVAVSAEDVVKTVPDPYTPADTIATFSSRGPRGYDSALKPEITAPGVGIFAANMGGGTSGVSFSGTSMAAPHVAGVAALMLQGNPDWTPEQVKAVMMNTAVPQVAGATIPRTGAGRIDAYRSVDAKVVAIGDDDLVSLNYGVIMSRNDSVTRTKPVMLYNWDAVDHVFDAAVAFQTGSRTAGATLAVDQAQVTVPAGGNAVVNVTLTLDMTQIPVQYGSSGLEEYYGLVRFAPSGGDLADTLLVPFYFQPRPYSQLDKIEADKVIVDPYNDIATFDLTHRGPVASDLWVYPALTWNAEPDADMAGPGDVRLFGMDYGGAHATYGDLVSVAIDAWNYWHVPQPLFAEFDLYVDVDQDGVWDYVNFNWNNGARTGGGNNNVWVVAQVDLSDGMVYLGSPFTIYTDYNASYMEWYLPAAWQDLGPTNSAFDYQLLGFDEGGVSVNPIGSFDYARWPLDWGVSNNPGPTNRNAEVAVAINDLAGYKLSQPLGAMIVDYNGDPRNQNGSQAYFAPIELTKAFLQVAHLAPFATDASVTIKLNGAEALTGFGYGDSTGYIELEAGEYLVEVFPAGSDTAAISATVELEPASYYTAIAVGDGVNQDLALVALEDDLTPPAADKFHLRLGHLAPFASGAGVLADVRLQDGTPILENVDFGAVTDFIPLDAGTYDLKITKPGGGATLIDPLPVSFTAGQIVSAFASGDRGNQSLGVFALPSGVEGFFLPLTPFSIYLPFVVQSYDASEWLDLTILHTNDFHARVDEYNRNGARCTPADATAGLCIAGAPRLATAVKAVRDSKPNVLLLDAGDQFQGTLFYNVFKGDVLNETMNYLGYDAMAIGNHEFDDGPLVLANFIEEADFPVLSANIDASADANLAGKIVPHAVLMVGGHEVGVIGLTTPDTSNISSPGPNVVFTDPVASLQAAVDTLEAQGVDKIIALTHMGYDADLALAAQVSGVDVIIGGHSHSFLYSPTDPISFTPPTFPQFGPLVPAGSYPTVVQSAAAEPVLVVTAYQWGTFLGHLGVTFDPAGLVASYGGNPIFMGADVAKDATLDALLTPYRDAVAGLIATEVGETTVDLLINVGGQQICRLGECLLGNLVADAMLAKANEMEPGANYQIAFQNGGGLRAPIVAGKVTMGDVMETLPFGNAIATFELKGEYVKAALENGASRYPSANGGFAQVSGLKYVIDPSQPVGSRIIKADVWNGTAWEALDMAKMYKVVTNDFMRKGGDNYLMFRDHAVNPYDFGPALDEALADYFRANSPVTPMIEGRVAFPEVITILHTNDTHGRWEMDTFGGGMLRVAALIEQQRQRNPNTILLDAGDTFQGNAFAYFFKDAADNPIAGGMELLDYDAIVVGNHEFNFGPATFTTMIGQVDFPVLGSANVTDDGRYGLAAAGVQDYTTLDVAGKKVVIYGLTNPRVPRYELPSNIVGLTFESFTETVQADIPAIIAAEDPDLFIGLTHLGYAPYGGEFESDKVLAENNAGIDVIIGGHSHTTLNPAVMVTSAINPKGTLIAQAQRYASWLGVVDVGFVGDEIVYRRGHLIPANTVTTPHAGLQAYLAPYQAQIDAYNNTVIGTTSVPLDALNAYTQETNAANLQTDAAAWALAQRGQPVDFHLSGAMANRRVAAEATAANPLPITKGDMFTLMPYENSLVVLELNGAQLKSILERGYRNYWYYKYTADRGGYSYYTTCMLDVSDGAVITYSDPGAGTPPNGNNVVGMTLNGNPVDFSAASTYTVSSVNYLVAGSCNFNDSGATLWPLDQITYDSQIYVRDSVTDYVATLPQPIAPAVEGRLVFGP